MDTKALRYAIEDANRFAKRAEEVLESVLASQMKFEDDIIIGETDQKTIRRLSLDVTHAMKDLRDSIDTVPMSAETTRTTA